MTKQKKYGKNVLIGEKTKSRKYEILLRPDDEGRSPWRRVETWPGDMQFGNGNATMRKGSPMDRKYTLQYDRREQGNKITHVRANGFNKGGKYGD